MRSFSGPTPNDIIYIKFKKHKDPWNVSLCEVIDGNVSKDETTSESVAITTEVKGKPSVKKIDRNQFLSLLEELFKSDKLKVEDFVILPEGETGSTELTLFLEKYTN